MPFLRHIELIRDRVDDFGRHPFAIPAIAGLHRLDLHPGATFLVGENGSGKSTLLEAIAIKAGFNPEGGTKNFTGSRRPTESELHDALRLARGTKRERYGFFLRAETMFNVATEAEGYGWESLHEMSHGEAFLRVMLDRFRDHGLYLLDEPEAALSPQRQLACLARLHQLVQGGSQLVVATHSPILMALPGARILILDGEGGPTELPWQETEHYQVTKAFLDGPERVLRHLLDALED